MRLAEAQYDNTETGCCARLDATQWDEREFDWTDRPFLKDHIHSALHIPIDTGTVMRRDQQAIESAAAYPSVPLWLTEEVSPWGADIYFAVEHPVPGSETVRLSGKFLTKVFEGAYRDIGKWIKAMDAYVAGRGFTTKRRFFYYATCPDCAKRFGRNQVVVFAQVA